MDEDNSKNLLDRIKEKMPRLSKGQKRIAEFLIQHYDKSVYLTAAKLGEVTGVSESTVVRFAIELGYDGYPKFQKALEELVKSELTARQRMEVTAEKMENSNKHILQSVLEKDSSRIQKTLNYIDKNQFDMAVDAIINAKKVYIVGGRSSYSIASFTYFYLNLMLPNVLNVDVSSTGEVFEQIMHIEEGDICIGISFPRYSKRTIKAVEYASERNVTCIAITDSYLAPIATCSKYNLITKTDMVSLVDSLVAPLSVVNALLVAVSLKKKDEVLINFDKLEQLWRQHDIYETTENIKLYRG